MKYNPNSSFVGIFKSGKIELPCMTVGSGKFCIHEVVNAKTKEKGYRVSHILSGYHCGYEALSFSNAYRLAISYDKRLVDDTVDIQSLIRILSPVKKAFDHFLKLQKTHIKLGTLTYCISIIDLLYLRSERDFTGVGSSVTKQPQRET